ncbi:TPR domain protein, putative component of TonB system [hydrothermal vent metagenome]|uniref:Probable UDP-N-acetylglucosamine--peptide N-acetylglucosaminyltransferase SPINDLY n=1 Tax=hydrothermal vent metagenome TaxID=652676 RepID=A0A3B0Z7E1_9ZZZZ
MNTTKEKKLFDHAVELHKNQRFNKAKRSYQKIIENNKQHHQALHYLGVLHAQQGNQQEAIDYYRKSIAIEPGIAPPHCHLGIALNSLRQYNEALPEFQHAIKIAPDDIEAHLNLANTFKYLSRDEEAERCLSHIIKIIPEHSEAHYHLGVLFSKRKVFDKAEQHYLTTIKSNPNHSGALNNLGIICMLEKRIQESCDYFKRVLEITPNHSNARSLLFNNLRQLCNWHDFDAMEQQIIQWQKNKLFIPNAFSFLLWSDNPGAQQACARINIKNSISNALIPINASPPATDEKIKIVYLSADFRNHPVAYLTAELYELHDRSKFEITAVSFGPPDSSPMRQRLINAFDHFHDVDEMNDLAIAELIASKGTHIIIDLMGHTQGARPGILAYRAAPIQINYLGYIGTIGADFIDYIIVDEFSVATDQAPFFDEQLIHLPCYMVTDTKREISDEILTRTGCGLPEEGFIFCSFNNSYKITPKIFDIWMQCLHGVPSSVLWLVDEGPEPRNNLCNEAKSRGIDPARLIFAPRVDATLYLARIRLADLFLDTPIYNAGTTACDALWLGLPVITCPGKTFVSRMCGGLLHAAGIPELIVDSLEAYKNLAIQLATNPEQLEGLKNRLITNQGTAPLFDSTSFCNHFEAALTTTWNKWRVSLNNHQEIIDHENGASKASFHQVSTSIEKTPDAKDIASSKPGNDHIASRLSQAMMLHQQNKIDEAANIYREILTNQPDNIDALHLLGLFYAHHKDYKTAIEYYDKALAYNPSFAAGYHNRGVALNYTGDHLKAVESLKQAIKITPNNPDTHSNLANILSSQGEHKEAIKHYKKTIKLNPKSTGTYVKLGSEFNSLKQPLDAAFYLKKAITLEPDYPEAFDNLCITIRSMCDWTHYDDYKNKVINHFRKPNRSLPFYLLPWIDDPKIQFQCATQYSNNVITPGITPINAAPTLTDGRINIGYISNDFRNHVVSQLTIELFELHNRDKFEVFGFALGSDDGSVIRKQLKGSFDHFIEVAHLSEHEIAQEIAARNIHILVDLGGYATGAKPRILALRPAPIQINYLGYIATMGASFIDYIIVDDFSVPNELQPFFTEQLMRLPSYMTHDRRRPVSEHTPTRKESGLPEKGFVFCCFNNTYKITPDIFDVWMRCMDKVADSVLWLVDESDAVKKNLRREAKIRGINPKRLIFAPRLKAEEYMARLRLADLFLDTLIYNAGATACDALWMGLPVLTCPGNTFVSRMGGGLAHAAGIPELVVDSLEAYETLAIRLANEPALLQTFQERLINTRETSLLFDNQGFCDNFEATLIKAWEKYCYENHKATSQKIIPDDHSQEIKAMIEESVALHQAGNLNAAETGYQAILKINPNEADALHLLGVINAQQGNIDNAITLYKQSIEANPKLFVAYNNLGIALNSIQKLDEATKNFHKAIELVPDSADAYYNLGNCLYGLQQYEEAVSNYKQALQINPDHPNAQRNMNASLKKLAR